MAPKVPEIPIHLRTGHVVELLEVIKYLQEQIQGLKDEIATLKGQKARPKIKPSKLDKGKAPESEKRPGSAKRGKTDEIRIDSSVTVPAADVPKGSRFKGYREYTVQELVIKTHKTVYLLERWKTPDGRWIVAELPADARTGHFGPTLISFVLYLYYQCHVTQPLIVESIGEFGVDISAGQVNRIITENKEKWHAEKDAILKVGLAVSRHIHVGDTGARHDGKNGYCTQIGNELFAWFASTDSKSRINFLELLRAGATDYVLNAEAFEYMKRHAMPKTQLQALGELTEVSYSNEAEWRAALLSANVVGRLHVRLATEGALLGSVVTHGLRADLAIVSDDAGQFDILLHALCWVHAERLIAKLVGFNDEQRAAIEQARSDIWNLYGWLKVYKAVPSPLLKEALSKYFDEVMTQKSCMATLNHAMARLHRKKAELLLVLERPDLPLHNNPSESDIRDYVKKRKISGSTRSDLGRQCRDTFASLKKTCRKLGTSFWAFINDRVHGSHEIKPLPELIMLRAAALGP